MKKSFFLMLCLGSMALFSCNKTEKKESDTAVVTSTDTNPDNNDYEAMSRERASAAADQMARDLKMDADTAWKRKASTVYYSRVTRRNVAYGKYKTDTTGMAAEMRDIDTETDRQFRDWLDPVQYKVYETNRTTYYGGLDENDMPRVGYDSTGSNSMSASSSGSESGSGLPADAKVKTKTEKDGDSKTKIETKNSETKIKTEDGQTTVKTKDKK